MFAKSKISLTVDRAFEKIATNNQSVIDARSHGHLSIAELLNQKQSSLKKFKKYNDLLTQDLDNQDDKGTSDSRHNGTDAEFAASSVATTSSSIASDGGSHLFKILGGLLLGGGIGAAAGGGGGSSSDTVDTNPSKTSTGSGDGINSSIAPVTFYSQSQVNAASTAAKDLLLAFEPNQQGVKWGEDLGKGSILTYGFSVAGVSQYAGYYAHSGTKESAFASGVTTFTDAQKALALDAMNSYANVSKILFNPYKAQAQNPLDAADVAGATGDIRWSNTSNMPNAGGTTYYPGFTEGAKILGIGGDIWMTGASLYVQNPTSDWAKNYVRFLFTHELGHALGLTHPHMTTIALADQDTIKYTVMSYNDYVGDTNQTRQSDYFPTTMMLNDIAAIQYLYGANTNIHTENTVYQWSPHSKVFETIYDAGGIDTIDASNQLEAVRINLNPGTFSSIGVSFNDGRDDVRDCLAMSYAVSVGGNVINLIENALGSIHDDTLIGNDANNLLVGNEGNDVLNGGLGNDTLQGGLGFDLLSGGAGEDIFVFDSVLSELNTDHIKDFSVTEADLVVLNHNIFSALTEIGQLLSTHFIAGAGLTSGQKADQLIVYNTTNGHLYYDPDGNGSHASICFAIIDNSVDLTANSFRVV